jgi:Xaa-Pro dipeptidase
VAADLRAMQEALREEGLDGWLFFDHHERDPLAYRTLKFRPQGTISRRWYYFLPAQGEPAGLVHRIEPHVLDALPGEKRIYSGWAGQFDGLRALLGGARRVAMQYSPNCAVPYVSMVDGGTIELVRGLGVEVASSANLIQLFEARWSAEQLEMHLEAGRRVDAVRAAAFARVGELLRARSAVSEYDIKVFVRERFEQAGLETDHGPIVAVNAHASDPHYEPEAASSAEIRKGDTLLIDLWAKLKQPGAVYYDITWTGYCGAAAAGEIENVFAVVAGARDRAVERVKQARESGAELHGFEVDDAARRYITAHGFGEYFVHRTGHSIGEDVHGTGANMDNLETHDERKVIAGTCFSIEPGIYLPEFGIRSEVNVYVKEKTAQVTGETQKELIKISV